MESVSPLPHVAKVLATLNGLLPAVTGVTIIYKAIVHARDPSPSAQMTNLPEVTYSLVMSGVILLVWAAAQGVILFWVWRNQSWAFLVAAILCLMQSAIPVFITLVSLLARQIAWRQGSYALLALAAAATLLIARTQLPGPRASSVQTDRSQAMRTGRIVD